jgi:CRP-like cAMP-binding protein
MACQMPMSQSVSSLLGRHFFGMHISTLNSSASEALPICTFERREQIPASEPVLWQIQSGVIYTSTLMEDGSAIPLGYWGVGDLFGQPISDIQPFLIECLTPVEVVRLTSAGGQLLDQAMRSHIHQMQMFLKIRQGQIRSRLELFLQWLAEKFGCPNGQGRLIPLRLTHQDIADAIGTTRVTVTRMLHILEAEQVIAWSSKRQIVLR